MRRALCTAALLALVASAAPTSSSAEPGPAVGNRPSYSPDVSSNGRFVVFASDATNLVPGDTNGKRDIFIRDITSRTTRLVSKAGTKLANGSSYRPVVSDDGRYVAFVSDATNLVPGDTNSKTDAFRVDLSTGAVVRVSVSSTGAQANGSTSEVAMSGNGTALAIVSTATNLDPGTAVESDAVYLRDQTSASPKTRFIDQWVSVGVSVSPNGAYVGTSNGSWSRASGRFTVLTARHDSVTVSNAGVSYSWNYWDGGGTYAFVEAKASPSTLSFQWGSTKPGPTVGRFDVSTWGATVALQDTSFPSRPLVVADKTGDLFRKSVTIREGEFAMAGGAKHVAYALKSGQVVLWNLATGTTVVVSTS